jgi:hypothetical protein
MEKRKLLAPILNSHKVTWHFDYGNVMNVQDIYMELENVEAYTIHSIRNLMLEHLSSLKISNKEKESIIELIGSYKREFAIPLPHPSCGCS